RGRGAAPLVLFLEADVPPLRGQAAREARGAGARPRAALDHGPAVDPAGTGLAACRRRFHALLYRGRRRLFLARLARDPWRSSSRDADSGDARPDTRNGGWLRRRLVFLYHQPAGALRPRQAFPRGIPVPAACLVLRRALRLSLCAPCEAVGALPVEDR